MALSTRKKNKIIAEWKAGLHANASQISKAFKIDFKTAKKLIDNAHEIEKRIRAKRRVGAKYLYLLKIIGKNVYKIGIAKDVNRRLGAIQSSNYEEVILIDKVKCLNTGKKERALHAYLDEFNIRGEWFAIDDIGYVSNEFGKYNEEYKGFINNIVRGKDGVIN